MLGDANNSDVSYTGASDSPSVLSLDYYRDKATQFQLVLNAVDTVANVAAQTINETGDMSLVQDLSTMLNDYDSRKMSFRLAAEGINAGASIINSMGGRFPQLSIPSTLGIAPLIIPATTIAAIGAAAALIIWGNTWIQGVNARLQSALSFQQASDAATNIDDPIARDVALREIARLQSAAAQVAAASDAASESPLSQIAGAVKWVALGAAIFIAWRLIAPSLKD